MAPLFARFIHSSGGFVAEPAFFKWSARNPHSSHSIARPRESLEAAHGEKILTIEIDLVGGGPKVPVKSEVPRGSSWQKMPECWQHGSANDSNTVFVYRRETLAPQE